MNVYADAKLLGERSRGLERALFTGERGVNTHVPIAAFGQKATVLGEPSLRTVRPVPVGDAVGSLHAYPDLSTSIRNDREAAFDGVGRFVVVDDGGGSRFEASSAANFADHSIISRSNAVSSRHQTCSRIP